MDTHHYMMVFHHTFYRSNDCNPSYHISHILETFHMMESHHMMELHHMMTFRHMKTFYLDMMDCNHFNNTMYDGTPSYNDANPSQTL